MISVQELERKIGIAFDLKAEIALLKTQLSAMTEDLERKQNEISVILDELGKTDYHSEHGVFSFTQVESFKVPKDKEGRATFFNYLKELGVYDNMITVDSRTLNAFAKQEIEAHRTSGDVDAIIDYDIPGIERGQPYLKYTMRRTA